MRISQLPAAVGAALGKALGLAVTTLLLLVGLAGTALARPLPDGGAATGCAPPVPGSDGGFSSLRLIVAIAVTVIVASGLAALIAAARRRTTTAPSRPPDRTRNDRWGCRPTATAPSATSRGGSWKLPQARKSRRTTSCLCCTERVPWAGASPWPTGHLGCPGSVTQIAQRYPAA